METCFERVNPLSKTRMILLFLHYFLGYQFVYPMLLTSFTLWLDPVARVVPDRCRGLVGISAFKGICTRLEKKSNAYDKVVPLSFRCLLYQFHHN